MGNVSMAVASSMVRVVMLVVLGDVYAAMES